MWHSSDVNSLVSILLLFVRGLIISVEVSILWACQERWRFERNYLNRTHSQSFDMGRIFVVCQCSVGRNCINFQVWTGMYVSFINVPFYLVTLRFITVRNSGAHPVTFPKIAPSAHTFNAWCFIFSWFIPYSKSFKCPISVSVTSQLVSTLVSAICRCVIWQNLPHIRGKFCPCKGTFCQWWDKSFYPRTPSSVHFSLFHSFSSITIYRE